MPLEYVKDDVRRRIRITMIEPVTLEDMVSSVERQLADRAWRYGLLVDARDPLVQPKTSDMKKFGAWVSKLVAEHGPRGPIAVVAKDSRTISTAQRHAFSAGKIESVEVFWTLQDAEQWLDGRLANS